MNLQKKTFRVKRRLNVEDEFGDNNIEKESFQNKVLNAKKLKLEENMCQYSSDQEQSKETSQLIKRLQTNTGGIDNFECQRVFHRPVFGEDCLNITSTEGDRVFLKLHPDVNDKEVKTNRWKSDGRDGLNLLSIPFKQLKNEVDEKRRSKHIEGLTPADRLQRDKTADTSNLQSMELWVEKYSPRHYTELLSDDGTNRILLKWLKLWDDLVFNNGSKKHNAKQDRNLTQKAQQTQKKNFKDGKFQKQYDHEEELTLDRKGRPKHKIALLCGNPGLGKTTLAHVISRHAGYNVVEMNASDDRSPELFLNKIEASTQMKAVIGESKKPNCLVIDEIDGAPVQAINILLGLVKATETGDKTKKKKKKREFILNRPIICICNDQFVPALRQLRQVAFTLHFPVTLPSRLANRLLTISQLEEVNIDMASLLLLSDKAENDIRSCLNTLQFIQQQMKEFKIEDIKTMDIGQKDMKKGVRSILNEVFQLPRANKKRLMNLTTSAAARFHHILHIVSANSDFDKMTQGLFDHYLNSKTKDPYLESINLGVDWLCFTDRIQAKIQKTQNFAMLRYSPFLSVAFHTYFARAAAPKIQYSNVAYENYIKKTHNEQTVQLMLDGMCANLRRTCSENFTVLDLLPYLFLITLPNLRPVNTQLYSKSEKQMFTSLIEVMIAYNLTYRQERNTEGQYTYLLEPNIEELLAYPGLPQHRHLPYAIKQLIAREVDLEKMRKSEGIMKPSVEENRSASKPANIAKNQKLHPKIIEKNERPQLDFFGRSIQLKESNGAAISTKREARKKSSILNTNIWFRFNAGYTNAVRRTVKVHDFV